MHHAASRRYRAPVAKRLAAHKKHVPLLFGIVLVLTTVWLWLVFAMLQSG